MPKNQPSEEASVYLPKRRQQFFAAAICFVVGIASLLVFMRGHTNEIWSHGIHAARFDSASYLLLWAFFMFAFGPLILLKALRHVPRLTITSREIRIDDVFRSSWVHLDSVGRFEIKDIPYGGLGRFAVANVIGPNASADEISLGKFAIRDEFSSPLSVILDDIQARQRPQQK